MEWIKRMRLKKALFTLATISLSIAALLSVLSFWICLQLNKNSTSYAIEIRMDSGALTMAENENSAFPPQAVMVSELLSILQIALPVVFFAIALFAMASLFYRLKLKEPLEILTSGAARIMDNDLDFSIEAEADDELGQLCSAFETMRQSLLKNNRMLWRQAEERKRLNAAFSHDLRNPVTVLKGSVKMAKQCAGEGTDKREQLMENLLRIENYTGRIERYVEIMSNVGKLEEVAVEKEAVDWDRLTDELENAMHFVVPDNGRQLSFGSTGSSGKIYLDKNMMFQIAENLVSNAVRFARQQIWVRLTHSDAKLILEVMDDGNGFPAELLKNGIKPFQKCKEETEHFGMGLYICSLLCQKHGGYLEMKNCQTGALVCAVLEIS